MSDRHTRRFVFGANEFGGLRVAHVSFREGRPGSSSLLNPVANPLTGAAGTLRFLLEPAEVRMFHSLLVPIDLSTASTTIVERAARLPMANAGRITLFHAIPKALPQKGRRNAMGDAQKALQVAALDVVRSAPKGVVLRQVVKVGSVAAEIASLGKSIHADLIVMGRGGGHALRDLFLGSTAERVIRKARVPVLVVRESARGAYRRPLLALDRDVAVGEILKWTLRILPLPRPRIGVVHAYDVPYYGLIYPSLSVAQDQELSRSIGERALREIMRVVATALVDAQVSPDDEPSWRFHIRQGSPRAIISDVVAKTRVDLLILGTHGYPGVAHALLGTVAGDVLREVPCDVLVVPPRRAAVHSK